MAKRRILPGIEIVYDSEELSFICDGEEIEDMEFTWDDFADPALLGEVSEELAEYVDEEESDVDNPVPVIRSKLRQLVKANIGVELPESEDDDEEGNQGANVDDDEEFEE